MLQPISRGWMLCLVTTAAAVAALSHALRRATPLVRHQRTLPVHLLGTSSPLFSPFSTAALSILAGLDCSPGCQTQTGRLAVEASRVCCAADNIELARAVDCFAEK